MRGIIDYSGEVVCQLARYFSSKLQSSSLTECKTDIGYPSTATQTVIKGSTVQQYEHKVMMSCQQLALLQMICLRQIHLDVNDAILCFSVFLESIIVSAFFICQVIPQHSLTFSFWSAALNFPSVVLYNKQSRCCACPISHILYITTSVYEIVLLGQYNISRS